MSTSSRGSTDVLDFTMACKMITVIYAKYGTNLSMTRVLDVSIVNSPDMIQNTKFIIVSFIVLL